MPVYAYACTSCGHAFDARQSFTESALTECPMCGGSLRKRYDSIGVTFNGSGFYRTDSRAAAAASSTNETKTSTKTESTTSTASTTPKPAATSGASTSGD